ncbi:hypothetical protein H4I96_10727 [Botrytis cinerea]
MHLQNFLCALTSLTLTNLVTSSPTEAGTLSAHPTRRNLRSRLSHLRNPRIH